MEALRDGLRLDAAQVRRMVLSLARYLVRMRGRATPFGLFAGVAQIRFGTVTATRWTQARPVGTSRRRVAGIGDRPTGVVFGAARRLRVVVNDLVVMRGDRLVVTWQPHASELGHRRRVDVSVRTGGDG